MDKLKSEYLRIVSDGTSQGTRIYVGDAQVMGVEKIEIHQLVRDCLTRATITFNQVVLGEYEHQDD